MTIFRLIAALLLLMQTAAPAQLTLTITDATGARVANAAVVLSNAVEQRNFTTGPDGTLELRDLPTGEWMLRVSKDGFIQQDRPVVIQGVPSTLALTLEVAGPQESVVVETTAGADPLKLESAATGGTRLDIPVRELPATLTIVSQELMQERAIGSATAATELAPGITTFVDSGSIPGINARGFSSTNSSVSLLRDGIKQNNVPQAGRPLDTFLLERIEVLKGPSALLYGEGATGASINYVTKEPRRQMGMDSLLSYGSFGSYRSGFGMNVPITDRLYARIDGSAVYEGGYVTRTGNRMRSMAGSLRWIPTESASFKASGIYTDDFVNAYYGTPLVNGVIDPRTRYINYNMRDNLNKAHNNYGLIDADIALAGGWRLRNKAFAATQRVDWRNFESVQYVPATGKVTVGSYFLTKRDDVLVADQGDIRKTLTIFGRSLNFLSGFIIQDNNRHRWNTPPGAPTFTVDLYNPAPIFDPHFYYNRDRDVFTNTKAVFMESLLTVTKRLKLVSGLRWDHIALDYTPLATQITASKIYEPITGRAGLVFAVTPNVNVYVSNSRSIEPTSALVSLSGASQQFSLQPTRQWETGVKGSFLQGRLDTEAAYFSIGKRNILTRNIVDGVNLQQQIGRQTSQGMEVSFAGRPLSSFMLAGDLTILNAEFREFNENLPAGGIISRSGNDVPHVPAVVWNLTPTQRVGPVTVSATVRNVGARYSDNANTRRLRPYTTLDVNLSVRFLRGTRLTLTGRNLTDEIYIPRSNTDFSGRIAAPRNYNVQLTKSF